MYERYNIEAVYIYFNLNTKNINNAHQLNKFII